MFLLISHFPIDLNGNVFGNKEIGSIEHKRCIKFKQKKEGSINFCVLELTIYIVKDSNSRVRI